MISLLRSPAIGPIPAATVARLLGQIGGERSGEALRAILLDVKATDAAREAAPKGLSGTQREDLERQLIADLKVTIDGHEDRRSLGLPAAEVATVLGFLGSDQAAPTLYSAVVGGSTATRLAALNALRSIGGPLAKAAEAESLKHAAEARRQAERDLQ